MPEPAEDTSPHFQPYASPARDGLAVIYDLSEFTKFFTAPDAHRYVPAFLNRVAGAITVCIDGGLAYWVRQEPSSPLAGYGLSLAHRKFLGDGELLIFWVDSSTVIYPALNRFWNVQAHFKNILDAALNDVPVRGMPPNIKFGIARGDIYELRSSNQNQPNEYIGVSINLASRLVKYCPELSFVASTRVGLSREERDESNYKAVVATKIRGFENEIVLLDRQEYADLPNDTRSRLFENLPNT